MSRRAPARGPGSIALAFTTLFRTLRHGYENLFTMIIMGIIWYLGALLIVPIGPLTAGLHRATQRMSEERATSWRAMLQSLRSDLAWSSLLVVSLVFGGIILTANMNFYAGSTQLYVRYLSITFFVILILWFAVGVVSFAVALRQQDIRLRRTLRNAGIVVVANLPGILISMVLLAITSGIFLLLPPLFILLPAWIALWGEEQTRLLLIRSGDIEPDEIADRPRNK